MIQRFSIYIAIIARKHPDRVPDLLGYQSLIIDSSIQYEGDSWIGYDRRFRLSAAANSTKIWASLDPTLWNLAFAGSARVSRCKHCFSLTHPSIECEWASEAAQPISTPPRPLMDPTKESVASGIIRPGDAPCQAVHMNISASTVLMIPQSVTRFIRLFIALTESPWEAIHTPSKLCQ